MDYEKLYKEALERAKYYKEGITDRKLEEGENIMDYIFPELKESEDEMIRKGIIEYLEQSQFGEERYQIDDNVVRNYIAWLEKQSTPQIRTGLEWYNTIDDACDKRYSEEYAHGEYCHEQSFKWGFQEGVEWLENQGEQKPIISNNALREGIAHFGITQYQIDNWLKKYVDVENQSEREK